MTRLTLAIAARTLFDADVEGEAAELGAAISDAVAAFELVLLPWGELLERLRVPAVRRFERARARLDATLHRIVAERRREGTDRGDLLSMLMLARDEDGGPGMSDLQLRDELMTLFLAGHETTANMLTWTWHLLGTHPDVERRLHAELDAALGDRPPTAEDAARLPYARQVLAESLRLYPPAWILGRRALAPYPVAGWELPPGTLLFASQLVVHRDARWWPDPDRFDPDRWAPGADAGRPRFAYFPFGAGTRVCIGEQFAWTEGVLVLAAIARRWRLRPVDPTPPPMRPSITLRPRGAVRMLVEPRSVERGAAAV
jgi:cytochrome P450